MGALAEMQPSGQSIARDSTRHHRRSAATRLRRTYRIWPRMSSATIAVFRLSFFRRRYLGGSRSLGHVCPARRSNRVHPAPGWSRMSPAAVAAPPVEFPPLMLSTDRLKEMLLVLSTTAVNCCCPPAGILTDVYSAGSRLAEAKAPVKMQLFRRIQRMEQPTGKRGTAFSARTQKDPCHEVTPTTNCHRAYTVEVTLRRQVAVHKHAGRKRVTPSQQSIEKPPACRIGAQKPGGRSLTTPKLRSSASPALTIVPSSNNRPISVTPWGTRRGGEKVGRG